MVEGCSWIFLNGDGESQSPDFWQGSSVSTTVVITQVTKDCRDCAASRPIYRFWVAVCGVYPWWRTLPMWI